MSLNFYASIDNFRNDSKDNIGITLKTGGSSLDHSLDKLRKLKNDQVVHITIESAQISYQSETDIETGDAVVMYQKNANGVWQPFKQESNDLDLGMPNTQQEEKEITADIVDNFLITQKYDYRPESGFEPKKCLGLFAEGFNYDEVAKKMGTSVTEMLSELNKARGHFAPYAAAWVKAVNDAKKNEDE
ncbi:MAG: DNA primase [Lentilactobacillus hilgardii]|uniref:DNA primase n=1 Tax=Lentilactobacillus hilgardii TaxID=1588 RepID=UPI0039E72E6F